MTGSSIAAEIAVAYDEAGVEAGDGTGALKATIVRIAPEQRITTPTAEYPDASEFEPAVVPGGETTHTFTAKPVSKMRAQREGIVLEGEERVYSLVNHSVTIAPTTADKVTVDGATWSITQVMAKDAAGHVLSWLVKVKK